MRSPRSIAAVGLMAISGFLAPAASMAEDLAGSERAEILVLGVYHMCSPGRDVVNMEADDILADKRQAEIAQLVTVLEKFQPTRIAVEEDSSSVARRYRDFVAGEHELTCNETEQIGFRLARKLGHESVYPADADGEFPFPRLVDYAKANGQMDELQALLDEVGEEVEATGNYLASHTVLETLLYMNSEEQVASSMAVDSRQVHFGERWNWAGADLVADWFRRNARIYSNIVDLVESPSDRILVIFGAGHLPWLQHMVAADPTMKLRRLAEFAD